MLHLRFAFASLSTLLISSCANGLLSGDDPGLQRDLNREHTYQSESGFSYWDNLPGDGPMRVTIDLSDQTAYFFKGSVHVGKSRVATGMRGHETPTGSFSITEMTVDKRSNLYGRIYSASGELLVPDADSRRDSVPAGGKFVGAEMPNWMRLTSSGIGLHAGPIPQPGHPSSHGCIRMPKNMAKIMFANARIGTPVKIVP
ncbi:L,D-transpeptidase family protein [Haloferula chungangensis]|uniref:L,D-transpeptidase family protein n=1 Tax=Haloferula chungangensis TaxID=1048331 RepID=A0ABW2L9R1_9BACT